MMEMYFNFIKDEWPFLPKLLPAHIRKYMYKYTNIEAILIQILLFLFVIIIISHSFEDLIFFITKY